MKTGCLLILLSASFMCFSQSGLQIIRGKVTFITSRRPLAGCDIFITNSNTNYHVLSDANGEFSANLPAGKYTLTTSCSGYQSVKQQIEVVTGKQLVVEIAVANTLIALDTVTIKPGRHYEGMQGDLWESQKSPAVFNDPARAVTTYAGPVTTDDQANNISVYGTSPNFIQWSIEGVEIVSPNHLENAGTINDRPAINGGGVSMLSAQLLESYKFQYAPFDPMTGNVLSGALSIRLRDGNSERYERTIQAGLMGIDLSIEGPLSVKNKISFLTNYRYSTVGLLSVMGVNFGDEKIAYQDFMLNITFPTRNGSLRTFVALGNSSNLFDGKEDSSEVKTEKELFDITYRSMTGLSGISYVTSINNSSYIKAVGIYSVKDVNRKELPAINMVPRLEEKDELQLHKSSLLLYYSKRVYKRAALKAGTHFNYYTNYLGYTQDSVFYKTMLTESILQPFLSLEGLNFNRFSFTAGIHFFIQPRVNYYHFEPRFEARYVPVTGKLLLFRIGKSAQMQPLQLYFFNPGNRRLQPVENTAMELLLKHRVRATELQHKLFYQKYTRLANNNESAFSAFNYFNEYIPVLLSQDSEGRVYGIDLSADWRTTWYYFGGSVAVYNSEYSISGNTFNPARFNTGYNLVINAGREIAVPDRSTFYSIDIKGQLRNGFGISDSAYPYRYSDQLPHYYRFDLRFSMRKDNTGNTRIWSLDIQNVTNRKNVAYYYFDKVTGKKETKYSLGIIPVISYKLHF
ncbi:MAG: carboxypeptidase-like regulatory domain-containing protein [Bacteroidota bacterium]|nr:carboxypeptidase-like regulatory domain-containing protein [Bacteroidota bacterium]